jgi:23S rRNA pseudouridine2605 synthase
MRETGEGERLQKVLARQGLGSRREIESWIRAGRLTVNGQPASLGIRVQGTDRIQLDGRPLRRVATARVQAFLCHRSPGEALLDPPSARAGGDTEPRRIDESGPIASRLPRRAGRRYIAISPLPRGDGGLELLTSDGELAARLQRAVHELTSEFSVRIHGELTDVQIEGILAGELDTGERIELGACTPAGGEGSNRWYAIEARGASGRELRRVLERQGASVSRILRVRLGPLALERSLARGQFRKLTDEELAQLLPGPTAAHAEEPERPRERVRATGSRKRGPSRPGSPGRAKRRRGR